MRAGKLDRTIIIQRLIENLDDYGAPQLTWGAVATLRAEIVQANTQEAIRDYGAAAEIGTTFRTRYCEGVTPADRVAYAGRLHDIKDVREIGRRRGLELRVVARSTVQ